MDEDLIRSEIEQAVSQVDDTLTVEECVFAYDASRRKLNVQFSAKKGNGETLEVTSSW